jgi:L-ascorbate metabolism protein UlaG (beta-lactamase superfamily)
MALLQKARREGKKFLNPVPTSVGSLSIMFKVLPLYLRNKEERTPRRPLGPFRTSTDVYASPPASGLRVTWIGHSTSLVEIDGLTVLIDPVWEQRAAPVEWAGPRRFFAAPLDLEQLPRIDLVLISHDHYDHLGARTIRRLVKLPALAEARWMTALGVADLLAGWGVDRERITELDWTESARVGSLEITSVPARHFSGRSLSNRFETLWTSFVLAGPLHRVYYGADSGEWDGMAEIGRIHGPFDLAMLEIGAFHPLWADIHMGPDGAIRFAQALGAPLLMPIHWGLFDLALHAWREPIERVFAAEGVKLWSPEPGCPTELVNGVEVRSEWWR